MVKGMVLGAATLIGLTVGSYQLSADCGKSCGRGSISATATRSCEFGAHSCSVTLCTESICGGDSFNDICVEDGGLWTCAS